MSKFKNLTGHKYGRLSIIKRTDNVGARTAWLCKCDCGKETIAITWTLTSGHTQSCGCYQKDQMVRFNKDNKVTHGGCVNSRSRLYGIWGGMKQRCSDEGCHSYNDYGGRGIKVCLEWENDFAEFRDWAESNGYNSELSIDRIEADGNYEPSNCRWATNYEQATNKRTTLKYELEGKSKTLVEWAAAYGLEYGFVWQRIHKNGMSLEKALSTPNRLGSYG